MVGHAWHTWGQHMDTTAALTPQQCDALQADIQRIDEMDMIMEQKQEMKEMMSNMLNQAKQAWEIQEQQKGESR